MNLGQICVREVDLAGPDEAVWQAAERMHQRVVGSLLVLDTSHVPIGILTDRDLVERVLAQGRDPATTLVKHVMTPDPITLPEDASLQEALQQMRDGGFRRLPLVNADEQLVGMLSLDDVLMHLAELFGDMGRLLKRETPRGVAEEWVSGPLVGSG